MAPNRAATLIRSAASGGGGIAVGTTLVTLSVDRPIPRLLGPDELIFLVGLVVAFFIFWAVRVARRGALKPQPGTFLDRAALVYGCSRLAFLIAAVILLAIWLISLAAGAGRPEAFLQALLLTVILSVLTRLIAGCVLNLMLAIHGPSEDIRAS